jgi:hypothetical protein
MSNIENPLDQLVGAVLKSPQYRNVCEDLIRQIGRRELAVRRNTNAAIKATKNKLHQVSSAYLATRIDYARGLEALRQAQASGDSEGLRQVCRQMMSLHASTQERLAILDEFYATTLAGLGPIRSVLDVACGLNPLAIPWMPLDEHVTYYAYDIYLDMVAFIREFLALIGVRGRAEACDVTQWQAGKPAPPPPRQQADVWQAGKPAPPPPRQQADVWQAGKPAPPPPRQQADVWQAGKPAPPPPRQQADVWQAGKPAPPPPRQQADVWQAGKPAPPPPRRQADLALILKTIPCLEQLDKTAGLRLLETIQAEHILVSFPVHSLGGRSKGMVENYEARFHALVQGKRWAIQRFEFATELAFLVTKEEMHASHAE